jgi:Ser/Thr protein kinase RdoA (MazF antagonist)
MVDLSGSERDQNFYVQSKEGECALMDSDLAGKEFVVKISNAKEDKMETNFQTQALLHVMKVSPGFPLSRVEKTLGGKVELELEFNGESNTVRLLSYLPGVPVREALENRPTEDLRRDLGTNLAKLGTIASPPLLLPSSPPPLSSPPPRLPTSPPPHISDIGEMKVQ